MDRKPVERQALEQQAMALPATDRARLAHKLLESLDVLSDAEREQLWIDEADRRAAQLDNGDVGLIPGEDVARKARALLK